MPAFISRLMLWGKKHLPMSFALFVFYFGRSQAVTVYDMDFAITLT